MDLSSLDWVKKAEDYGTDDSRLSSLFELLKDDDDIDVEVRETTEGGMKLIFPIISLFRFADIKS